MLIAHSRRDLLDREANCRAAAQVEQRLRVEVLGTSALLHVANTQPILD